MIILKDLFEKRINKALKEMKKRDYDEFSLLCTAAPIDLGSDNFKLGIYVTLSKSDNERDTLLLSSELHEVALEDIEIGFSNMAIEYAGGIRLILPDSWSYYLGACSQLSLEEFIEIVEEMYTLEDWFPEEPIGFVFSNY